jgi:hypothetical protein
VRLKIYRYQSVKSILAAGLDRQPLPQLVAPGPPLEHANIRGAEYYADGTKPAPNSWPHDHTRLVIRREPHGLSLVELRVLKGCQPE